jgi:SAM-dependent methyltransferase
MSATDERAAAASQDEWEDRWSSLDEATQHNPAHAYRRRLIFEALPDAGHALRLLDLGCGQGHLLSAARGRLATAQLVGVDFSRTGLELARARVPEARFFQTDFAAPCFAPELEGWASHMVCSEVLEHLDEPARLLAAARELLAPDGCLLVTVPGGWRSAFDRHIGHRRHYSPRELADLVSRAGYRPLEVVAAGFPFFNLYKLVVIARGEGLIRDLTAGGNKPSKSAALAMRVFDALFRLNRKGTPWGWQTFGVFARG